MMFEGASLKSIVDVERTSGSDLCETEKRSQHREVGVRLKSVDQRISTHDGQHRAAVGDRVDPAICET